MKALISIIPLLLLKTIIVTAAYLLLFPVYAIQYPNIELLVLSLSALPWSLQIVSSMVLFEFLFIFHYLQNRKGRIISALLFSLVFVISSNIWIAQETAPHLLALFGFSFIIWTCSHYSLPESFPHPFKVHAVSTEVQEDKGLAAIILYSIVPVFIIPGALIITSFTLCISIHLGLIAEFSLFGIIIGLLSGFFTYLIKRVQLTIIRVSIIQQILPMVIALILLFQFWSAPPINWVVLLFSIVILSSITYPRIVTVSQKLKERITPSYEQVKGLETFEVFLKIVLRDFLGVLILFIAFGLSAIFEGWIVIGFVLLISTLSYSVVVALPSSAATQHPPVPNLLVLGVLLTLIEFGMFSIYWRRVGEIEIVIQRYRRVEPFVAILIAFVAWISFLVVSETYAISTTLFTLVVLMLCQTEIFRHLAIGERMAEKKFAKWTSKSSLIVSGVLALVIVSSTLLIRYNAHLWLAGLPFGLAILIGVFGMTCLVIGISFSVTNGLFTAIQRDVIKPQGPVLLLDVVRDVIVTMMVLLLISPLVTLSFELLAPLVLIVIVVPSIREHNPSDWKRIQFNELKVFSGIRSYRNVIVNVTRVIGIVALLIIGTWSSLVIYESVANPKSEVRVAVVDTGVNPEDPQISTHLVASKSFVLTQYGYDYNDTSTSDQVIHGFHGTKVAKMVLGMFPRVSIINAKVLDKYGASAEGIAAAIHWVVEEEGADVINLSLGGPNLLVKDNAVEWAWKQGVVVVTAAGNGQDTIQWGASIESPANSPYSIAVAALQNNGSLFDFSSWGPVREAFIKPDVSALGNVFGSDYDRGTSFASPRVAGVAAALVDLCLERGLRWTPGLIKAAILKGANPLAYPEYMVGAGRVNLEESMNIILDAPIVDGAPYVAYVSPSTIPLDMEHVFTGTEYKFTAQVTCSVLTNFDITQTSSSLQLVVNSSVEVNQTLLVPLTIITPDSLTEVEDTMTIQITARGEVSEISCNFNMSSPVARIAIDISHSISFRDSIFIRYFRLYEQLANLDIAITEIRDVRDFRNFTGRGFDALLIMNPWIDNSTMMPPESISAIRSFYNDGGGVFFAPAQNGIGQNVTNVNEVLNWTGVSFLDNETRYYYRLNVSSEVSTEDLEIGSLSSWILNTSINGTVLIATGPLMSGNALMVGLRGLYGRMIVAGTNSMFYTEDLIGFSCLLVDWLIG